MFAKLAWLQRGVHHKAVLVSNTLLYQCVTSHGSFGAGCAGVLVLTEEDFEGPANVLYELNCDNSAEASPERPQS